VHGLELNPKSGCAHYHSPLDIIAIKFKCCGRYFACRSCHDALADHPVEQFNSDKFQEQAVLCGSCGAELQIATYLACNAKCPHCQALFNPECKEHWDLYFKINELVTTNLNC
jgi:uncharacterized CHY-type Zn-finger protein